MDERIKHIIASNMKRTVLHIHCCGKSTMIAKPGSFSSGGTFLLMVTENTEKLSASFENSGDIMICAPAEAEKYIWLLVTILNCSQSFVSSQPDDNELSASLRETANSAISNWQHVNSSSLINLRNSLLNIPLILRGVFFEKHAYSKPAIICGAGPSLKKDFETLRTKRDKFFLFAPGRVGTLLLKNGIKPDLIIQVDPETEYDKSSEYIRDIVLAAPVNISHNAALCFENILWCSAGKSISNGLNFNDFEVSATSTVTAIDSAFKMGFTRIALLANDLCLSEDKKLHPDNYFDDSIYKFREKEIPGKNGGTVASTPELDMLRLSIESYLEKLPLKIFNCTSRGAAVLHSIPSELEDFLKSSAPIQNEKLHISDSSFKGHAPEFLKNASNELKIFTRLAMEQISSIEHTLSELAKKEPDSWTLETINKMRGIIFSREKTLAAKPLSGQWIKSIMMQTDFYFQPMLIKQEEIQSLNQEKERCFFISLFCKELSADLEYALSDLTAEKIDSAQRTALKSSRNPLCFESFKNYAVSLISRKNTDLARLLSSEYFNSSNFELSLNWQNLPYVRKLMPDGTKFPLSGDYLSMERAASSELQNFFKTVNFNERNDALVFFAPGNWLHPFIFSQLFKETPFIVIDPWPELLAELIKVSMFMYGFGENAAVAAIHENLNWQKIYADFKDENKSRRLLFFENPHTWNMSEIKELAKKL